MPKTPQAQMLLYVQNTDPGAVGAGALWVDTSTDPARLKMRGLGNTDWGNVGTWGVEFAGSGGGVSGAAYLRFDPFGGGFTIEQDGSKINVDTPLDVQGQPILGLPTSDPHVAGALWNNGGTPAISAG